MDVSEQKPPVRMYARAAGYVQGVGFRYFVCRLAELYGVTGWVRNREYGDVELEAQGRVEQVQLFLQAVELCSGYAEVLRFETHRLDTMRESSFEIADW